MPFTPAHVAAVLPVVGRRARWVVPAAWVVGSMSPDLVYFTPAGWVRPLSHSLTGLLTLDPALGAAVLVAWWTLLGPAGRDLLPRAWRARVAVPVPPPRDLLPWVLVGLLGGSLTHVAWDGFTHHDGRVVQTVPELGRPLLGSQPAYSVLQDLSGLLGLTVVVLWAVAALRRSEPVHDDAPVLAQEERRAARFLVLVLPLTMGLGLTALAVAVHLPLVSGLFLGFTRSVGISTVVALIASAGWRVLRGRRAAPSPAPV